MRRRGRRSLCSDGEIVSLGVNGLDVQTEVGPTRLGEGALGRDFWASLASVCRGPLISTMVADKHLILTRDDWTTRIAK
jgi:hypothetical protein